MPWPDQNGRGRALRREPPGPTPTAATATNGTTGTPILPDAGDRQYRARWRLAAEHRRLGIARLAHQAMPLTVYHRHPKDGFYCRVTEGWRAA
jgi:hypothetical protein